MNKKTAEKVTGHKGRHGSYRQRKQWQKAINRGKSVGKYINPLESKNHA